jgi:hypothetical protein
MPFGWVIRDSMEVLRLTASEVLATLAAVVPVAIPGQLAGILPGGL